MLRLADPGPAVSLVQFARRRHDVLAHRRALPSAFTSVIARILVCDARTVLERTNATTLFTSTLERLTLEGTAGARARFRLAPAPLQRSIPEPHPDTPPPHPAAIRIGPSATRGGTMYDLLFPARKSAVSCHLLTHPPSLCHVRATGRAGCQVRLRAISRRLNLKSLRNSSLTWVTHFLFPAFY